MYTQYCMHFMVMTFVYQSNWTPMMISTSAGHIQIVKMLIGQGAMINVVNCTGQCSLHYAASRDRLEVWKNCLALGLFVKCYRAGC